MRLSNSLKHHRSERDGMSQQALAVATGVTRQTIISIEKGRFVPSTLLALKLARFFETSVEDLFHIETEDPEQKEGPR